MRTITIIAGTHGVGKTSFLGAMQGICEYIPDIIDEAKIFSSIETEREMEQLALCNLIGSAIQWDLPVTLKTTLFSGLVRVLSRAKEQGYRIRLDYIALSSAEDSIVRIQNRVKIADGILQ